MFFNSALTIALIIFAIGMIHKIDTWFVTNVGSGDRNVSIGERFRAGFSRLVYMVFSGKFIIFIKVLFTDVLLQKRILTDKKDSLAWIMHICIFVGFIFLLVFHALGSIVTVAIDAEFQSTLNPYMLLRNLFGALTLVGLVIAVVRRAVIMRATIHTSGKDIYAIAIIFMIILSGFGLEALKITSHDEFMSMVDDYGDSEDLEATQALEAYWVENYGVVAPEANGPFSDELLALGEENHEMSCMECHSQPQSAFVSYALSRIVKPFALGLDSGGVTSLLWYIHILASFFGLAYLPFSKMFHVFSTPVSLIIAGMPKSEQETPAVASIRQVVERDGCSHGGLCHENCPVRIERLDRIQNVEPFGNMFDFLETRSGKDLGSRESKPR